MTAAPAVTLVKLTSDLSTIARSVEIRPGVARIAARGRRRAMTGVRSASDHLPTTICRVKSRTAPGRKTPRPVAQASVDEYFARLPEPGRTVLAELRSTIRSVLSRDATEVISYQIPAFARDGVIVWYAAFARHVSLFPRNSVLEQFKHELAGFKTSKGTVQFPLDRPLPTALIKRIVKARLAEHLEHQAKKRR